MKKLLITAIVIISLLAYYIVEAASTTAIWISPGNNTSAYSAPINGVFPNIGVGGTTTTIYDLAVQGSQIVTGGFYDAGGNVGTNGMVLQTTGTSTVWTATSSLGLASATSSTSSRIRSLFSATYPILYSNVTGVISSMYADSAEDGVLSSTDWNTFNSKLDNFSVGLPVFGGGDNRILYSGHDNMVSENAKFVFDEVTFKMGIGTATPQSYLSVVATTSSATPVSMFEVSSSTGATLFKILGNGRVGIGTTTPDTLLTITANDSSSAMPNFIKLNNTSTNSSNNGSGIGFYQGSSKFGNVGAYYNGSSWRTAIGYDSNKTMVFPANGYVGINGDPVAGLTVSSSTGRINDYISIKRGITDWRIWVSDVETGTPSLRIGGNSASTYAWQFDYTGTTANTFKSPANTASQHILEIKGQTSQTGNYFNVSSSGGTADIMVVKGTGRVGIGTSTPAKLFDVFATGTSTVRIDSTTKGSCLVMKDSDGSGYTYITAADGVLTAGTTSCE